MLNGKEKRIGWGIIGCGDVTEVKSGPAFNAIEGSSLLRVMRRDANKVEDYAKRHGVPEWSTDADDVLADKNVNAVYVATPPSSHKDYVLRALSAGKNVYCEKPFTLNAPEAKDVLEALERAETNAVSRRPSLVVAHYRRALPFFLRVKELLDSEAIGQPLSATIRLWQCAPTPDPSNWRVRPQTSGGGLFHDLSPHQLDLMLFFFGRPVQAQGVSLTQIKASSTVQHPCAADNTIGTAIFDSGVVFNGHWCVYHTTFLPTCPTTLLDRQCISAKVSFTPPQGASMSHLLKRLTSV